MSLDPLRKRRTEKRVETKSLVERDRRHPSEVGGGGGGELLDGVQVLSCACRKKKMGSDNGLENLKTKEEQNMPNQ